MKGQLAELTRRYAGWAFIEQARRAGKAEVDIVAGDVHKDLNLHNQMPTVCDALDSRKFQDHSCIVLVQRSGPRYGATARWRFRIGESEPK